MAKMNLILPRYSAKRHQQFQFCHAPTGDWIVPVLGEKHLPNLADVNNSGARRSMKKI